MPTLTRSHSIASPERQSRKAVDAWVDAGARSILLTIPLRRADLCVPAAEKHGFGLHHAAANEGSITMQRWLADGPSKIPPWATHFCGVGCAVVDAASESVVVVKEHQSVVKDTSWKFPSGTVDPGEEVAVAAVREIKGRATSLLLR